MFSSFLRWIESRLNGQAQEAIRSRNSSWRPAPAPSSVPQGSRTGPVLFNTFINALNDGPESTPTKFADHNTLGGVDDTPSRSAVFQRDLGRLEKRPDGASRILTRRSAKSCTWGGTARNK